MSNEVDPLDSRRRVIPRWRDFRTTLDTGELRSISSGKTSRALNIDESFINEKIQAWQNDKNIRSASDLLGAAFVAGKEGLAHEVAEYIAGLKGKATIPVGILRVVKAVLREQHPSLDDDDSISISTTQISDSARLRVRSAKAYLREYPRNVFLWVDLARAYTILGQPIQATRAMDTALKIAGENRFVARSAARLFIHNDDPERAHRVFRDIDGLSSDPWLLATEISSAALSGHTSKRISKARSLIKSGLFKPFDTTELTSELGTIALAHGSITESRRWFKQSLILPTENTVAQAQWAHRRISGVPIAQELLLLPRSFEAGTRKDAQDSNWKSALANCENWLLDEPFSTHPAIVGSFLSIVALEDNVHAEDFARAGLKSNPDSLLLLNNLAVALASQNKYKEAREWFEKIPKDHPDKGLSSTLLATEGLILFREKQIEAARKKYEDAIAIAESNKFHRIHLLASTFLAREEESLSPERHMSALKSALNAATASDKDSVVLKLVERADQRLEKLQKSQKLISR